MGTTKQWLVPLSFFLWMFLSFLSWQMVVRSDCMQKMWFSSFILQNQSFLKKRGYLHVKILLTVTTEFPAVTDFPIVFEIPGQLSSVSF